MSWPLSTRNFVSNFSLSSRCHWKARFAGQTIKIRSASPRSSSSRIRRPDMMVLPAPASSASRNRTFEQVVVDRLELMRQRVNARDREPEVGIELVRDAQGVGLQAEA